MNKLIHGTSFDLSVIKAFGIPTDHMVSFSINIKGGEPVTINCEYLTTQEQTDAGLALLQQYNLVKKE